MSERPGEGLGTAGGELLNLDAVRADDALVDLIASGGADAAAENDQLTVLLAAWCEDTAAAELPEQPDLDAAVEALAAGGSAGLGLRAHRWASTRVLAPVTAAAVVGFALLGIGVAAHSSNPGDPLWGVSQTLFADHSRSVQAAADADSQLDQATAALNSGEPEKARQALVQAARFLSDVDSDEGREDLMIRASALVNRAERETDVDSTTTSAPAVTPAPPTTTTEAPLLPIDPTDLLPPGPVSPPVDVSPPVAPTRAPVESTRPPRTPQPTGPTAPPLVPTTVPPTTVVPPTTTEPPPTTSAPPTTTPAPTTTGDASGEP